MLTIWYSNNSPVRLPSLPRCCDHACDNQAVLSCLRLAGTSSWATTYSPDPLFLHCACRRSPCFRARWPSAFFLQVRILVGENCPCPHIIYTTIHYIYELITTDIQPIRRTSVIGHSPPLTPYTLAVLAASTTSILCPHAFFFTSPILLVSFFVLEWMCFLQVHTSALFLFFYAQLFSKSTLYTTFIKLQQHQITDTQPRARDGQTHQYAYSPHKCILTQLRVWSSKKIKIITPMRAHTTACSHNCLLAQLRAHTTACSHNCVLTQLPARTTACSHNCLLTQLRARTSAYSHNCVLAQLPTHTTACSHKCLLAQLLRARTQLHTHACSHTCMTIMWCAVF